MTRVPTDQPKTGQIGAESYNDCFDKWEGGGQPTKGGAARKPKRQQRTNSSWPLQRRFYHNIQKTATCWLWTGTQSDYRYGQINRRGAHRVSYELHIGPIPPGLCVLHRCDTPLCVNPDHLFLGTQRENIHDAIRKGRFHPWIDRYQRKDAGARDAAAG